MSGHFSVKQVGSERHLQFWAVANQSGSEMSDIRLSDPNSRRFTRFEIPGGSVSQLHLRTQASPRNSCIGDYFVTVVKVNYYNGIELWDDRRGKAMTLMADESTEVLDSGLPGKVIRARLLDGEYLKANKDLGICTIVAVGGKVFDSSRESSMCTIV